jgi:hypothetical protein
MSLSPVPSRRTALYDDFDPSRRPRPGDGASFDRTDTMPAMDLRSELRYAAAPSAVFAMITDEEFLSKKAVATGALSHELSVTPKPDGGVSVRLEQVLPADVPDFARRLVGETIRVRQTDVWGPSGQDGGRDGTFTVEIGGMPARMAGTLLLQPDPAGGSVERFAGEIKVSVPFIGGKLEKLAADAVRAAVVTEGRVGRAWLASRGRE